MINKFLKKVTYRIENLYLTIKLKVLKNRYKNLVLGKNVLIERGSKVYMPYGKVIVGNNVLIRSKSKGYHGGMPFNSTLYTSEKDAIIKIGENTRLNGVYVHARKKITIGNNCVFAAGTNIIDSNGHELYSKDRTHGRDNPQEIVIGNNVWLGINVIILKGSIIGDNCVVSANSVVKGVYPNNSVITGNPAKIVKTLIL